MRYFGWWRWLELVMMMDRLVIDDGVCDWFGWDLVGFGGGDMCCYYIFVCGIIGDFW